MKLIVRGMGGSKNLMITRGMGIFSATQIVKEIIEIVSYINKTIDKNGNIKKIENFLDVQIPFARVFNINSVADLE